jgi:hypothetical protein
MLHTPKCGIVVGSRRRLGISPAGALYCIRSNLFSFSKLHPGDHMIIGMAVVFSLIWVMNPEARPRRQENFSRSEQGETCMRVHNVVMAASFFCSQC